ncbi:RsmB/NOP family class I SAM-dependent RNA methyltransferase [Candidatus Pacearchaeota archaeon]|nr:RsmB/NOP family class I SAM-dependent RNA methyltransferase [Candidatus Pacearchaeota archaeon]
MSKLINPIEKANPIFLNRIKDQLKDEKDYEEFCKISIIPPVNSIRCNTIKISPVELKKRLEKKWEIKQPFPEFPEIMIVKSKLSPGELGKAIEHILGYYYIQEISSMMPALVLNPKESESIIDLAAAPGSKTTQIASMTNNKGVLIANEVSLGRISILSTNLQRCGVTNTLVIRQTGESLCKKLVKLNIRFDKVLADVPCSGEGTIRSSPKTVQMFSENLIKNLSNTQKYLATNALKVLKLGGDLIYSTCTHAPEENEAIISYLLDNFPVEIQKIELPLKTRPGITKWKDREYNKDVSQCVRIYPQDNNTEGFFIAHLKKTGEIE